MQKIAFLVKRLVYQEEGLDGFPGQITELVLLTLRNNRKIGCRLVDPGSGSHAEQLTGRHEKKCLSCFVVLPW